MEAGFLNPIIHSAAKHPDVDHRPAGEMLLLLFAMILLTLAAVYLYLAYQLGMTSVNAAILLVVRGT